MRLTLAISKKYKPMKYERIDKRLFERNRAKFTKRMKENTVAVFNSNDIYPISADSTMPFEQHRDIFYLSGVDQEESILVLFPNASDEKHREVLFLKETNDHIAVWEGEKLTKEAAFETAGIKTVYWLGQFDTIFNSMMAEAEGIISIPTNIYAQTLKRKHEKTDSSLNVKNVIQHIKYIKAHLFYMKSEVLRRTSN